MTYTSLRKRLDATMERVCDNREIVIVRRRGGRVAIIAAEELAGVTENIGHIGWVKKREADPSSD